MPSKTVTINTAGQYTDFRVPIGYNRIGILSAQGVIDLKDARSNEILGLNRYQGVKFNKDQPEGLLSVRSTLAEMVVIFYGLNEEPFEFGPAFNFQFWEKNDGLNIFTRPADVLGASSFVPGNPMQVALDGETFVCVQLDPATYVSGASTQPLLYTAGQNTPVLAEMIDMGSGVSTRSISKANTWYKIKTQGGSLLSIPSGSITGNGPGNATNFYTQKGYSTWEDQDYGKQTGVIVAPGNNNWVALTYEKPQKAKGVKILVDVDIIVGTPNILGWYAPQCDDSLLTVFNPIPAAVSGGNPTIYEELTPSAISAAGHTSILATIGGDGGGLSGLTSTNVIEVSTYLTDKFVIAFGDSSGSLPGAWTIKFVLEWEY